MKVALKIQDMSMMCYVFVCQSNDIVNFYFRQECNSEIFYSDQRSIDVVFFIIVLGTGKIFLYGVLCFSFKVMCF